MSQQLQQRQASTGQQSSSTSTASGGTSNAEAIAQLQGQGPNLPPKDLGEMDSSSGFASFAGSLIDSIAPDEGSSIKLVLTGKIPLYKAPAISVFFKPNLDMGISKKGGKLTATMSLRAAVEASADAFMALKAALEASFKGTLSITGDSGDEIFQEFMLSLRYVIEGACEQVSLPDDFKEPIVNGVMSDADMQETIAGMDGKDQVKMELEAAIKGSAEVFGIGGSLGASISNSTTLKNDGNDNLTTTNQTTTKQEVQVGPFKGIRKTINGQTILSVRATHDFQLLNQKVTGAAQMEFKNNQVDKLQLSGSSSKELSFDQLCDLLLGENGWLRSMKDSVATGLSFLGGELNNPMMQNIAGQLGGTSLSPDAANVSELGKEVTKDSVEFDGKAKIKGDATVSWQRGKGFKFKIVIATNNSVSLGMGGNSITLTENDRLMDLTLGNDGLNMDFS